MSTKKKQNGNSETTPRTTFAAPEGYVKRSDDLVGFWAPEFGPIHFIPQEATVSDSKLESQKQSGLIRGVLVDACESLLNADGERIVGKPGDRVGVWAKPDMRPLRQLAGEKVFMYVSGEKDTGKPNPMQLFEVCSAKEGDPLPIEDRRKLSKGHGSWLAPALS